MSSFSLSLAYFFFNYTFHSHMFTALRYGWQPKFAHTYSYGGLQITNSYQILCNRRLYKTFLHFLCPWWVQKNYCFELLRINLSTSCHHCILAKYVYLTYVIVNLLKHELETQSSTIRNKYNILSCDFLRIHVNYLISTLNEMTSNDFIHMKPCT